MEFHEHDDNQRIEDWEGNSAEPQTSEDWLQLSELHGRKQWEMFSGRAVMQPLFSTKHEEAAFDEVTLFFPDIEDWSSDIAELPIPLSGSFWYQYAEPLDEFQRAVKDFKSMVGKLGHAAPWDQLHPEKRELIKEGYEQLNSIMSVSPAIALEMDGTFAPIWIFPSLLAVFAFEVWQKLTGGNSVLQCKRERCGKLFLTKVRNREYCSPQCRMAEEKARQRARSGS